MRTFTLAAALVAATALPLAAQQPRGRMMQGPMMQHTGMMMPGMDSMMAPMMHVMASSPAHLLAEKTTLHLTTDQISRLTALRDAAKAAHDAAARQAAMHMRELAQVMDAAAPDTAAARTHFDAAHQYMTQAMWAMITATAQARAVLTDAQRKQVDEMASRPMRGGMMRMRGTGGR